MNGDYPGGFCTRGCTFEGKTDECPGGAICSYAGGTALVCAPICSHKSQCRDRYDCKRVTGVQTQACSPS